MNNVAKKETKLTCFYSFSARPGRRFYRKDNILIFNNNSHVITDVKMSCLTIFQILGK